MLIDAEQYFACLERAFRQAERSILIIGWDFDGRIRLCPQDAACQPLGEFLRCLVEERSQLELHILVWSFAVIHAPSAVRPLLVGAAWQDHPRIKLRLDREHPVYGAHHQKIVCIDDALAFAGGMDLTISRWDTCEHQESHRHRFNPEGTAYSPVHDVQMAVSGDAARSLSELARDRWKKAALEEPNSVDVMKELWPDELKPDLLRTSIAIARTAPTSRRESSINEIARLTLDILSEAKQAIYIETQYLTSRAIRDWMEKSLAARRGPEIVIIVKRTMPGRMEKVVMGTNRDRVVRRLRLADRHRRLRIFYPVVTGRSGACEVSVHSKVLIADDTLARIGSSNLNNRSMGLDTECDLAIEATDDRTREAITDIRNRLLAEHLGATTAEVRRACQTSSSLISAIDRLNGNSRGLRPLPERDISGPLRLIPGTWLLDPARPLTQLWWHALQTAFDLRRWSSSLMAKRGRPIKSGRR